MSVSSKFLEVPKETGKLSGSFNKVQAPNLGRIDKRQITRSYGQEVLSKPVWRPDPSLAEGRASPFDSGIAMLDTDYNTWLASLKSNVSDADIEAVDKELQDLELKHSGFRGEEMDTSFLSSSNGWLIKNYPVSGSPYSPPGIGGSYANGIIALFTASKSQQDLFKEKGLISPYGSISASSVEAALQANPGVSGLTYQQALDFSSGTWLPPGKKPSIAPVAEYGDTLKYKSYKESLEAKRASLEAAKTSGLANSYGEKVSELLKDKATLLEPPTSYETSPAITEALVRAAGLKALETNPSGERPIVPTRESLLSGYKKDVAYIFGSPYWVYDEAAIAAAIAAAKQSQEIWDKGWVGRPEVLVLGQGAAALRTPESVFPEVATSLGWTPVQYNPAGVGVFTLWYKPNPNYISHYAGYGPVYGGPAKVQITAQDIAWANQKGLPLIQASIPAAQKVVDASLKAQQVWDATVFTGSKWTPDKVKVDAYLSKNPDARGLLSWDSTKLASEFSKESLSPELVNLYTGDNSGGALGSLVRGRQQSLSSFNERLKSLQDLKSSYISGIDAEKASRLSELESLKSSKATWQEALKGSVGYWDQVQGPRSSLAPSLASKLGLSSTVTGTNAFLPSQLEGSLSGIFEGDNPYTKLLDSLAKKKEEWETSTAVNPYEKPLSELKASRASYDADMASAKDLSRFPPHIQKAFASGFFKFIPVGQNGSARWGSLCNYSWGLGFAGNDLLIGVDLLKWTAPSRGEEVDMMQFLYQWNSQDFSSWARFREFLQSNESKLNKLDDIWKKDKEASLINFKTLEDSLKKRSDTYESQKDFFSNLPADPSGVSVKSDLTSQQSLILKAYSEGQRDLKSLSTYSGLKVSEVGKVLDDLGKMGKLGNPDTKGSRRSPAASLRASRLTTGDISNTSSSFWKRVTSI